VKPPPFDYEAPAGVDEAVALLAEHGEEAKLLAGGQSLIPLLNFRLAHPALLVDVNRIAELDYVRTRDGSLHVGALTRQAALERAPEAAAGWPLLVDALRFVAHPQIRNRGTVGGSLAHADAAAELPVVACALDARLHLRSARGARTVGSHEFFVSHFTTALADDEMLVEIELPPLPAGTGTAFVEYSRRHGDFALGGAAAVVTLAGGECRAARIALLGAAPTPVRAHAAEAALRGGPLDARTAADAAALAVADIEPAGDAHGDTRYRRELIEATVRRALVAAGARTRESHEQ
jgi:6-hydroxypseudooxynicotine dehydrogenase subunit alpha